MAHDLQILILEDLPADAELTERELRKAGLTFTSRRVETEPAFLEQLTEFHPDLILADYALPSFDGLTALRLTRARHPELPFILLSAGLGEERAIESLQLGATDYVLKQRMSRLVPAVQRALREREERRERQRAEAALRESEEHFRTLIENSSDGIALLDRSGVVRYLSASGQRIMGRPVNELVGQNLIRFVHLDDWKALAKPLAELMQEEGRSMVMTARIRCQGGEWRWMEGLYHNLLGEPGVGAIVVNFRDITERKRAEEEIRLALEEKVTLLREVHHRVKNNLQAMIALMDMQASHIQDTETRRFLEELQGQARTMALVYEQLYQSETLARVAMGPYLRQLTSNVLETFGGKRELQLDLDASVMLDVAQAMPCGLIVNELFTNILKHAFPPDFTGRPAVGISLRQEGEKYRLTVSDNGVGLPPGCDWRTGQTLGLRLVRLWATHQLGGTLDVTGRPGIQFTTVFGV